METLKVELGARSYPIYIGIGLLSRLEEILGFLTAGKKLAVVTTPPVSRLYLEKVKERLSRNAAGLYEIEVPDGEEYKRLAEIEKIFDKIIDYGLDRGSLLLALGGGVIGDMTGFAAATFMRGIKVIQIPTTLLAMVDSSVGGKTGVNHPQGKNLIGAFHQPSAVVIDLNTLKTLPEKEFISALAEVIKYGIIKDKELFIYLEKNQERILKRETEVLSFIIRRSLELKAQIVTEDEREKGLRMLLNFGHTLGHALEAASEYRNYRHGEAVALGMIAAAEISRSLGGSEEKENARIKSLIQGMGLPIKALPEETPAKVLAAVAQDKKRRTQTLDFVIVERIGQAKSECIDLKQLLTLMETVSVFA